MDIHFLSQLFLYCFVGILAIVPVWVLYSFLTGRMPLTGLFTAPLAKGSPRGMATSPIDLERLALFGATLAAAGFYVISTFDQLARAETSLTSLPEMPEEMLLALGLSQTGYVTGKLFRAFKPRSNRNE